jgi:hypothetical protein
MIEIISKEITVNIDHYVIMDNVSYIVGYQENCIPEWEVFDTEGNLLEESETTSKLIDYCKIKR